jgi:hypothetical protein
MKKLGLVSYLSKKPLVLGSEAHPTSIWSYIITFTSMIRLGFWNGKSPSGNPAFGHFYAAFAITYCLSLS